MSGFEGTSQSPDEAEGMDEERASSIADGGGAHGGEDGEFIEEGDVAQEFEVGDANDEDNMVDEGDDGEEDSGEEEAAPVEDMAKFTFERHSDAVYCVAVNPKDPTQFVSGGGDDRGFLWTMTDGAASSPRELTGHTDTVASVGFSADGSLVATGCYGGVTQIWEAATGTLKHALEGPEDIECLAWHTSGNVLLTGSQDGTVWMWDATAGTCMQVFAGHEHKVSCVMFTSSGKAVVTGSDDSTVRIWAPRTGECRHTFTGHGFHEGGVTCLARHPDQSQAPLIMSGGEDGTARVMHVQNKRVLGTLVHCDAGQGSVEAVGFCASHSWVATAGTDANMKVWDSVSGSCRHTCGHAAAVTRLEWHPIAPLVFTSCVDGNVRIWDARTGHCTSTLSGHTDMILDMRLASPRAGDGESVATPQANAELFVTIVTASDDKSCKLFQWTRPSPGDTKASVNVG